MAPSPIKKGTREITLLVGSSSREELNRTCTLLDNPTTATPTVGWLVDHLCGLRGWLDMTFPSVFF